jgi:hypothetical protein
MKTAYICSPYKGETERNVVKRPPQSWQYAGEIEE